MSYSSSLLGLISESAVRLIFLTLQEVKRGPGTLIRRNSVTPLTSPESNIKKPRIDDLDEAPIQELPPSVASLALCSPSHLPLALAGQVRQLLWQIWKAVCVSA